MVLEDDERFQEDAEALLSWQDPETGAWPFHPGAAPSRLGTALAVDALQRRGMLSSERRELAVRWLLDQLMLPSCLEEDSHTVPEGYELEFSYAPRLVPLACVVDWFGSAGEGCQPAVIAMATAHIERRLRISGRPCPELSEVRLWHFIDFAWGHGALLGALDGLPEDARERFDVAFAKARQELVVWVAARELPRPLRPEALRLAQGLRSPASTSGALASHFEQVFHFILVLHLAGMRAMGGRGQELLADHFARRSRGWSDIFRSRRSVKKAMRTAELPLVVAGVDLALEQGLRERQSKAALERLVRLRNGTAHGRPAASARVVAARKADWLLWLDVLHSLHDVQLVTLDRVAHDAVTGRHVYRWVAVDDQEQAGLAVTSDTHADLLSVGDTELRAVFARDRKDPGGTPLNLLPFVGMGHCDGCGAERMWIYDRHEGMLDGGGVPLQLSCAERCETVVVVDVPVGVLTGRR